MIAVILSELASLASASMASVVIVATEHDGPPVWLLALGPAGAGALYFGLWRYYRNTHQSHSFERETRVDAEPITGHETKVDEITGTKAAGVDGANHTDHRERVQRLD